MVKPAGHDGHGGKRNNAGKLVTYLKNQPKLFGGMADARQHRDNKRQRPTTKEENCHSLAAAAAREARLQHGKAIAAERLLQDRF